MTTKKRSSRTFPRRRAAVAPAGHADRRNAVERTPAPPMTERGSKTRDRLKEAAADVLEHIGYRAMRLADIAAKADVNVSLFYHYFSSKADITNEILSELLDSGIAQRAATRPATDDPFDVLVNANLGIVETYAKTPGLMRCLVHFDEEEADFSKLYRRVSLEWNRRVAHDIAKRCPDAPLSDVQRLMIAYALGGMVDNFLFEMYVDRNRLMHEAFSTAVEVATFLATMWYRSLYAQNPPADKVNSFKGFAELRLPLASQR